MPWYAWLHGTALLVFGVLSLYFIVSDKENIDIRTAVPIEVLHFSGLGFCLYLFWNSSVALSFGNTFIAIAAIVFLYEAYCVVEDVLSFIKSPASETDVKDVFAQKSEDELLEIGQAFRTVMSGRGSEQDQVEALAKLDEVSPSGDAGDWIGTVVLRCVTVPIAIMGAWTAYSIFKASV